MRAVRSIVALFVVASNRKTAVVHAYTDQNDLEVEAEVNGRAIEEEMASQPTILVTS